MHDNEEQYREYLRNTTLVVAFFEKREDFPEALESVQRRLAAHGIQPDKGCILYRTRCEAEPSPRLRVWTQLVPFDSLSFPESPRPPWVGLNRDLARPMTDRECQTFLDEHHYEVFEIRVSKRFPKAPPPDH